MFKKIYFLLITSVMIIISMGCSTGSPSIPILPDTQGASIDIPEAQASETSPSNRTLLGMWQLTYDEASGELTPEPMREAYAHFNITPSLLPPNCADCFKTKVNSFNPVTRILDTDITLRNPTTSISYDVRGIMYTNDYGHELTNADDWTGLWDIPGGKTLNPFKAFAKSVANRAAVPGYLDAEKYLVHMPIPQNLAKITYAVDASWPGNCKEPYSIDNFTQEPLYSSGGGQAQVTADVLDWQNDVSSVSLSCKPITGVDFFPLTKITGNKWGAYILNAAGAPAGDYSARLIAKSSNSASLALYDYVTITITGVAQWDGFARTWGGTEGEPGRGVTTDSSGNVYVTGIISSTNVDFDPGSGSDIHSTNGYSDIFISKFDSSGAFQWARTWGGELSDDVGEGVATDSSGNVYVTGYFTGPNVDFDPGSGSDIHSSNGYYDVFVSKFNSSGDFQWVRIWGGGDFEGGYGIATDSSDNVYVTGFYDSSDVDFDPGAGSEVHSSNGTYDAFVSKFNSSGTFQWARTWGGTDVDKGYDVATDISGNVCVTGFFQGANVNFNPGGSDLHSSNGGSEVYISKFNSNGAFQWARTWGGSSDDWGTGVAMDSSGNAYAGGYFQGTNIDLDPGAGSDPHSSNGSEDVSISKFNSSGTFQWARTWGGTGDDESYDVATDSSGNVIVAGWFISTDVDFDTGAGSDIHSSAGVFDVFVSKFNSSGAFQWARTWGGIDADVAERVATDSSGNVYVTGWYVDTVDFNPGAGVENHTSNGTSDVFLSRIPAGG